jgi:uncharacterized protein YgiM (DUF1202 family)
MPRTLVALVVLVAMILLGCAPKPAAPPAAQPQAAAPTAPAAPPAPAPAPPPAAPATPPPSAPPAAPPPPAAPAAPAPAPARPPAPVAAPAPAAPAKKTVYVKVSQANFREAAGTSGKILRVLRRGSRLEVLETRNDWLRVRLDDGPEGWVAESVTSATAP